VASCSSGQPSKALGNPLRNLVGCIERNGQVTNAWIGAVIHGVAGSAEAGRKLGLHCWGDHLIVITLADEDRRGGAELAGGILA
jgi:hypothetical protein